MEKSIQICYARKEGLGTGGLLYEKQEDYIQYQPDDTSG
jgi:hypothetical protein